MLQQSDINDLAPTRCTSFGLIMLHMSSSDINACWLSVYVLQIWPGHAGFRDANRTFWRDDDYGSMVLGYIKSHSKLTHVVIRNAGHMVSC